MYPVGVTPQHLPIIINTDQFLELSKTHLVLDVRTPAEFVKGNIPEAINLPLFTNEERTTVGTIYKQQGKEPAILKGLEIVGPKMKRLIEDVQQLSNNNKTILMHCWRGGMRSGSVAWLLELYGYKVYTLKGGYKFFRKFVLSTFNKRYNYLVLGGHTGSGKTLILKKLADYGEQIIDLENLAHHKGSSFGSIGEAQQPTQEQFENKLAVQLYQQDSQKTTWIEDESRLVGCNIIPSGIWEQMRTARLAYIDIPFAERANYLVQEYGAFDMESLEKSVTRIAKRLGGQQTKKALEALQTKDIKTACEICLVYYDKSYDYGLSQRKADTIKKYTFERLDINYITTTLRKTYQSL